MDSEPEERAEEREIGALLRALDHPMPPVSAESVLALAGSRRGAGPLRWAAAILLIAGVAGAAYAIPGSPVRSWVREVLAGRPATVSAPPAPRPDDPGVAGIAVRPGRRLVILFRETQQAASAAIVFEDRREGDVLVAGPSGAATFRLEGERLTVDNSPTDSPRFEVRIPRDAPHVEIHAGPRLVFLKQGSAVTTVRLVCSNGKATSLAREDTVSTRVTTVFLLAAALACR
ncbi:MAG TPA: hypothetical protein VJ817_03395 [Gemmatimonadales bacterium]|nr:hypothetical protein [Gemmatimonadales bacterium]